MKARPPDRGAGVDAVVGHQITKNLTISGFTPLFYHFVPLGERS